jgi:hypothetical protein
MWKLIAAGCLAAAAITGCGNDKEAACKAAWEQQVKTTSLTAAAAGNQKVIEACQGLDGATVQRIADEAKAKSTSKIWNPDAG